MLAAVFHEPECGGYSQLLTDEKIHLADAAPLQVGRLGLVPGPRVEHFERFDQRFPRGATARHGHSLVVVVDLKANDPYKRSSIKRHLSVNSFLNSRAEHSRAEKNRKE